MAHAKWYQKPKFKTPFPAEKFGDGSTVECVKVDDSILLAIRLWPSGNTDRVRITRDEKGIYQYQVALRDKFGKAKEFIGDPDWHAPYVYSNAIPGTSPSSIETYDPGTGETLETREKHNKYYREHGLTMVTLREQRNMSERTPPKATKDLQRGQFRGSQPLAPQGTERSVVISDINRV
jgi:hypothetical protein